MTTPSDAAPEAPAGALPEPGRLSPDVMTELAVSDGRGSASDLAEFQRAAWSNLVLSVTQRCPLTCRHCITSSLPGSRLPLLTVEQARSWAFELPELRQRGLEHITFTGGEPTLARSAVRILADAAAAAGLATTIVTSGAFATSRRAADRTVSMLGSIGHWDLGYDTFHAEALPLERFALAVNAVLGAGRSLSLRVCRSDDAAGTEMLLRRLRVLCGDDLPIVTQPVRRLGRGTQVQTGVGSHPIAKLPPCLSTGPLVREDGSVAPCCSGLAYPARSYLPFRLGNGQTDGLGAVWRAWREDQALRLMRLVGLVPVLAWLRDDGIEPPAAANDVCELCVSLWDQQGKAAATVARRAANPQVRDQLDRLEAHIYGRLFGPATDASAPARGKL